MNDQAVKFRVGVFFLASAMLLGILVVLFGPTPQLFKRQTHYFVTLDHAPGVGVGTPIRRSGVRIGEVSAIQLDDESTKVRLTLAIDRGHTLRRSDKATLSHGLLGGDATIDLLPPPEVPPPDLTPLAPGDDLPGVVQPNMQLLVNQTSELMPSTHILVNDLRKTLERFNQLVPQVEGTLREYHQLAKESRQFIPDVQRTNDELLNTSRMWGRVGERADVLLQTNQDKLTKAVDNLNDTLARMASVFNDENQRNLAQTLKNVKNGSDNLEQVARNTEELLKESRKTLNQINDSVKKADEVFANLQQATQPMAERSASVMRNLEESTERLNRAMQDTQQLIKSIQSQNGAVKQFFTDPALYNNLNDAACMATRILPRVDRVLRDLEVFADKIARHPEALGVGGVVRPGSGLK